MPETKQVGGKKPKGTMVVGEWAVTKPSRSDDVLHPNDQLQIANQVRAQFEAAAPKRPAKPNRSESDTVPGFPDVDANNDIPELDKLRSLQNQKSLSPVFYSGGGDDHYPVRQDDEFVETRYYKEMGAIDKQHHTTGSGFIKVAREESGDGFGIELGGDRRGVVAGANAFYGYRSNPATNDWTPSLEDHINGVAASSKPNRSEGS